MTSTKRGKQTTKHVFPPKKKRKKEEKKEDAESLPSLQCILVVLALSGGRTAAALLRLQLVFVIFCIARVSITNKNLP
jgi:hypothetical protein